MKPWLKLFGQPSGDCESRNVIPECFERVKEKGEHL